MGVWSFFKEGLSQVVYPDVCLACGHPVDSNLLHHICDSCLDHGFAEAGTLTQQQTILPAQVIHRQALWKFDHGGRLQHLLHHLKYYQMPDLGYELGRQMGRKAQASIIQLQEIHQKEMIVIPVPLHRRKLGERGYNQARRLAMGFAKQLDLSLIPMHHVIRNRNTVSQTGFSTRKRLKNISGAFEVVDTLKLEGRTALLVDDVFTTGSTTFELARTLIEAGVTECAIFTLAEA
jgi:ComF family protein